MGFVLPRKQALNVAVGAHRNGLSHGSRMVSYAIDLPRADLKA